MSSLINTNKIIEVMKSSIIDLYILITSSGKKSVPSNIVIDYNFF